MMNFSQTVLLFFLMLFLWPQVQAQSPKNSKFILILGDSWSTGHNMPLEKTYPYLIVKKLRDNKFNVDLAGAPIPNYTTEMALNELEKYLLARPNVVLITLGSADARQAKSIIHIKSNLEKIISKSKASGAKVLLVGLILPPKYGETYRNEFANIYSDLARSTHTKLVEFPLKDEAASEKFMQKVFIAPNEKGHEIMALKIYPQLKSLL